MQKTTRETLITILLALCVSITGIGLGHIFYLFTKWVDSTHVQVYKGDK